VRTLVVVTNSRIGDCPRCAKSTHSVRMSRMGFAPRGLRVIGREHARSEIQGQEQRRIVEGPSAHQDIQGASPKWAERGGARNAAPEILERAPGALRLRRRMAVRQHGGTRGPGGCARNAFDPQLRLFQQSIEHAPSEGAVRAAALQREIHRNLIAIR
jgi:hypothetical protein